MAAAKGIWTAFTLTVRAVTGPWTRSNGAGWVALILFILVLRWAFFELYSIPSGSMSPTLNGDPRYFRGDRVAVNKFLFGPRIPFTTNRIVPFWEPKRWDIVVFNNVKPDAKHPILIKRVVGLPGERIHISNGRIHINGEAISPPPGLEDVLYYSDSLGSVENAGRKILGLAQDGGGTPASLDPRDPNVVRLMEDVAALRPLPRNVNISALSDDDVQELIKNVRLDSL